LQHTSLYPSYSLEQADIKTMMLIVVLVTFHSCVAAASQEKTECTEGLKARATLKFAQCQEPLLPVKWCHELFRDTLGYVARASYDRQFENKTHEDEYCKTRKKLTSCEHLKHLTGVCGAGYDTCHSVQEKREIMRMWIKQFIRGTHEIYWEGAFADDIQEIVDGECNDILSEYFNKEEVAEINGLTNSGPNSYKEDIIEFLDNYRILRNTKVSNLSQPFGVLRDSAGNRIDHHKLVQLSKPSHWTYCSWKMKNNIDEDSLFNALGNLFHCDGKCNTNDGDNQEWFLGSTEMSYVDVETNENQYEGFPNYNVITGDTNNTSIHQCIWRATWNMQSKVADNVADLDKAKMELCKPFKTILVNCSIPINECIDNIAVKEVVMAQVLKEMEAKIKQAMEIVDQHTSPNYFGDFSYADCAIFGGDVAGTTFASANLGCIVLSLLVARLLI